MLSENEIIEGCARHDRRAQQMLYDRYSRLLFGICMRYASDRAEAEDILQESFLKIYFSIKEYSGTGSFTGWMRKIVVNTAITHYHRNLKHKHYVEIEEYVSVETGVSSFEEDFFTSDELFKVLNELPPGYRMVFNLYAIEGYKHKEIAEMLGIDINTSKSQYSRAKAALREKLEILRKLKEKYNAEDNIADLQK
ncbi:MAG TPA: RNA polymerase sigma factor [Bacteroidales bacterium]|nr:RNA polymerase sigma factor [Bacteroidales bacterium]HRR17080.1 RNA polymerase sigma factor [Bacteroidales bacterium]HRT47389.1 RNA polymerase sigma factor [Bacteroidales bacterium]HRU57586.1 RNA polymerase sigma factor [Bacteroidales bacterium]